MLELVVRDELRLADGVTGEEAPDDGAILAGTNERDREVDGRAREPLRDGRELAGALVVVEHEDRVRGERVQRRDADEARQVGAVADGRRVDGGMRVHLPFRTLDHGLDLGRGGLRVDRPEAVGAEPGALRQAIGPVAGRSLVLAGGVAGVGDGFANGRGRHRGSPEADALSTVVVVRSFLWTIN